MQALEASKASKKRGKGDAAGAGDGGGAPAAAEVPAAAAPAAPAAAAAAAAPAPKKARKPKVGIAWQFFLRSACVLPGADLHGAPHLLALWNLPLKATVAVHAGACTLSVEKFAWMHSQADKAEKAGALNVVVTGAAAPAAAPAAPAAAAKDGAGPSQPQPTQPRAQAPSSPGGGTPPADEPGPATQAGADGAAPPMSAADEEAQLNAALARAKEQGGDVADITAVYADLGSTVAKAIVKVRGAVAGVAWWGGGCCCMWSSIHRGVLHARKTGQRS